MTSKKLSMASWRRRSFCLFVIAVTLLAAGQDGGALRVAVSPCGEHVELAADVDGAVRLAFLPHVAVTAEDDVVSDRVGGRIRSVGLRVVARRRRRRRLRRR